MVRELHDLYRQDNRRSVLIGSGNGIRKNPLLKKITRQTFGMQLKVPVHQEEAAVGAAMFAMTAAGIYENIAAAGSILEYQIS